MQDCPAPILRPVGESTLRAANQSRRRRSPLRSTHELLLPISFQFLIIDRVGRDETTPRDRDSPPTIARTALTVGQRSAFTFSVREHRCSSLWASQSPTPRAKHDRRNPARPHLTRFSHAISRPRPIDQSEPVSQRTTDFSGDSLLTASETARLRPLAQNEQCRSARQRREFRRYTTITGVI